MPYDNVQLNSFKLSSSILNCWEIWQSVKKIYSDFGILTADARKAMYNQFMNCQIGIAAK